MGIQATNLENVILGGPLRNQVSVRFQAKYAEPLVSCRWYRIFANHPATQAPGYARGMRGQVLASLYAEVGGVPTAVPLLTGQMPGPAFTEQVGQAVPGGWEPIGDFPLVLFSSWNSGLAVGSWYHLIFCNEDREPAINYCSIDLLNDATVLNQTPDMQVLVKQGAGAWTPKPNLIPSPLALFYASGSVQGYAGYEVANGAILNANRYGFPASLNV